MSMIREATPSARKQTFNNLWNLVGNTPMVEICYRYRGKQYSIFAKCEYFNLTGSIKDRMALYILEQAYASGWICEGDTIIEATSGNTGISFSAIGKALGHPVKIIMPDWLSRERMDIIKSLGAEVVTVSKAQGGFLGSIELSETFAAAAPCVFLPRQFANTGNVEAHDIFTGREIWAQVGLIDRSIDAFVAGVGTGGTVMGVGKFLRSKHPQVKIHPIEPAESPTLTTGYKVGSHRIQGISDEFIPRIVKLDALDRVVQVNDGDAILVAQMLASTLGLGVGISAGANVVGAIKVQQELGPEACVVTVLCDSNKKYLSTDLVRHEPVKPGYIAAQIEFTGFRSIRRLSNTPL